MKIAHLNLIEATCIELNIALSIQFVHHCEKLNLILV